MKYRNFYANPAFMQIRNSSLYAPYLTGRSVVAKSTRQLQSSDLRVTSPYLHIPPHTLHPLSIFHCATYCHQWIPWTVLFGISSYSRCARAFIITVSYCRPSDSSERSLLGLQKVSLGLTRVAAVWTHQQLGLPTLELCRPASRAKTKLFYDYTYTLPIISSHFWPFPTTFSKKFSFLGHFPNFSLKTYENWHFSYIISI